MPAGRSDDPDAQHFDSFYRAAGRDPNVLPWANQAPHPLVTEWLGRIGTESGRAVVVACGLGDDAEALAQRGWEVTAFDVSPTAIEWCRERFPDTTVHYRAADLFRLPDDWIEAFDAVVEVWTIQSLPFGRQPDAMRRIAELVAPGGALLLGSIVRSGTRLVVGPPWPPSEGELDALEVCGLQVTRSESRPSRWSGFFHFTAEYRRPPPPFGHVPR